MRGPDGPKDPEGRVDGATSEATSQGVRGQGLWGVEFKGIFRTPRGQLDHHPCSSWQRARGLQG